MQVVQSKVDGLIPVEEGSGQLIIDVTNPKRFRVMSFYQMLSQLNES